MHRYLIGSGGYSRAGIDFLGTGAENAFGCIGAGCGECANRVFERVAEIVSDEIKFAAGRVGYPENAV